MKRLLQRLRGAIGMGLTWAIGWGVTGIALAAIWTIAPPLLNWFFRYFDAPAPALAMPGFFAGVFFSIVLGIAGRDRKFSELSLLRFAGWGALGGVMLTLLPVAMVAVGLASTEGSAERNPWLGLAIMGAPIIVLSTLSACVTLLVARMSERREAVPSGESVAE